MSAIYISIKPIHLNRIVNGTKNYEFRNYIPKKEFDTLYVYESYPTSSLKYIIKIDKIVKAPDKIDDNGIGNIEFNQGDKTKYAYHIDKIYKIKPINLKTLKEKYHFTPPQGYAYDTRYKMLTNYLKSVVK